MVDIILNSKETLGARCSVCGKLTHIFTKSEGKPLTISFDKATEGFEVMCSSCQKTFRLTPEDLEKSKPN